MQLKAWTEDAKNNPDKNQFYLKLEQHEQGILLMICDNMGKKIKHGSVLDFAYPLNLFIALAGLNTNIHMKMDEFNQAMVINEVDYEAKKNLTILQMNPIELIIKTDSDNNVKKPKPVYN